MKVHKVELYIVDHDEVGGGVTLKAFLKTQGTQTVV